MNIAESAPPPGRKLIAGFVLRCVISETTRTRRAPTVDGPEFLSYVMAYPIGREMYLVSARVARRRALRVL